VIFVLAPHDLRHPLVAHAHDLGNGLHRQAVFVGRPDGAVSLSPQLVGGLLKLAFAAGIGLGKGCQAVFGLGCLALRSGDVKIVRPILANRLA